MRACHGWLAAWCSIALAGCAGAPDEAGAAAESAAASSSAAPVSAETTSTLERWRAHLAFLTRDGDAWWTSNRAYREEDGMDAYLMWYEPLPGGLSARGCLWGEAGRELRGPFWTFFLGWDPAAGTGFVYQASPGGAVAQGLWEHGDEGETTLEQWLRKPDGQTGRIRHESEVLDADTEVGSSSDWNEGRWVPRRTHTWERRAVERVPCADAM